MSIASKKRRRIARAAAVARGELQPQIVRADDRAAIVRKYSPSWLNACLAGGVAPRWTNRLKRHGGMLAIEATRELQFERIDALDKTLAAVEQIKTVAERHHLLQTWRMWLSENKLRLLSPDIEEFFWPSVIDTTYGESEST